MRRLAWMVVVCLGCDRPVPDVGPIPRGQVRLAQTLAVPPIDPSIGPVCDCDDANPCTVDPCVNGVCEVPRPVTDGTPCNTDFDFCTVGMCKSGTCLEGPPMTCPPPDQCHDPGTCIPYNGQCSYPLKPDTTPCNADSNACTAGDNCKSGICQAGPGVDCPNPDQCHDPGSCNPATGVCSNPPKGNGTPCNADNNGCTTPDSCQSGTCRPGPTTTCGAGNQCQNAGTCDPSSGACLGTGPKMDGTPCNDGTACTRTDTCQSGTCTGGNPVVCSAQDQCHTAGVCNPTTGACSNPAKGDGAGCDDGNSCTRTDTCQTGSCRGGNPVVCTPLSQCNYAGTCNPATGVCSNPPKTNASCNDNMPCTYEDTCAADGACVGKPVSCVSDDTATRECNGSSTCTVTPKPGAACDDNDPCTKGDVRQPDGSCAGMPYTCPVTACLLANACDGNGGCRPTAKPDGTDCDADQSKCTPRDSCRGGVCTADPKPVACVAKDCNMVSCNPSSGNCEYVATSGGRCGLTGCYMEGTCVSGTCSGQPKDCSGMAGPCSEGVCDALTGQCVGAPKPNGTACSAGGRCAAGAVCAFGVCELAPATCPAATAPCKIPACDPGSGMCIEQNRPAGSACDPKNSCMTDAVCDNAGNCLGVPAPNGDPCTLTGGKVGKCAVSLCVPSGPIPDGGLSGRDAGATDAPQGNGSDGGVTMSDPGGCGCDVGSRGRSASPLWLALLALALRRRRR